MIILKITLVYDLYCELTQYPILQICNNIPIEIKILSYKMCIL